MDQPPIIYMPNSLVITISTTSPSATHSLLLKGINQAIQYSLSADAETKKDAEALKALLQLQETLLPNETGLQKAFE